MEEDGGQAMQIAADDDSQAPVDPQRAAEQRLEEMFHDQYPVTWFLRSKGLTLQQVRTFVKTQRAERHASILDESSGQYPLHQFVSTKAYRYHDVTDSGWLGLVADLIRAFPQALLWQSKKCLTPLYLCASRDGDSEELCRLLVDFCPAACMIRDTGGKLPLQIAVEKRNSRVASILLDETIKCGVDLSQEKDLLIHLAIARYIPGSEFIKHLLRKVPGSSRMKDEKGELPLTRAARSGKMANPSIIRALVESYPEALRTPDEHGNLPVHIAPLHMVSDDDDATEDYVASMKVLIDGYPEGLLIPNSKDQLPLHACISIATTMNETEDIDKEIEVMRMLSERCPEAHVKLDKDGNLPLHFACAQVHTPKLAVVTFLAEQNEQALRTANPQGCLPLHLAVQEKHCVESVVRFLAGAFPEGVRTKNNEGNLPLHDTISAGCFGNVTVLVEAFPEGLQTPDAKGNLPLHLAVDPSQDSFPSKRVFQYLLDQFPGAARHANATGSLPLHLTCSNHYASFSHIELLVRYYPDGLSFFDGGGLLPFHHLCLRNHNGKALTQEVLQTWFQGKDLPWTRDNTPALFFACENHASLGVIRFLAEKSPDLFRTAASKAKVVSKKK